MVGIHSTVERRAKKMPDTTVETTKHDSEYALKNSFDDLKNTLHRWQCHHLQEGVSTH